LRIGEVNDCFLKGARCLKCCHAKILY
jgi:hypothetical protein